MGYEEGKIWDTKEEYLGVPMTWKKKPTFKDQLKEEVIKEATEGGNGSVMISRRFLKSEGLA